MEYLPWFNELLEALAYLGRRAAGNTAQRLLERLQSNGVQDLDRFRQRLNPSCPFRRKISRSCLAIYPAFPIIPLAPAAWRFCCSIP